METEKRISCRVTPEQNKVIERACEILGSRKSSFVLSTAINRAYEVIEKSDVIIPTRVFPRRILKQRQ